MNFKLSAAGAILALLFAVAMGAAVPTQAGVSSPATGKSVAAAADGLVSKVHGCHRNARRAPKTGVLHRHAGPYCVWKKAGGACQRWRGICRDRCRNARWPGRCRTRCYANNAPPRCF